MRLIVSGSRRFEQYTFLKMELNQLLRGIPKEEITIIAGGAKGADTLAIKYAKEKDLKYVIHHALWNKLDAKVAIIKNGEYGDYNARAGIDRNERMAKDADHLIAFWDGKSPGTKNMIDLARDYFLNVRIVKFA